MFDPELPAGFQDADFDMRELEDAARRARAMRRKGICPHYSRQGRDGAMDPALAATPAKPRRDAVIPIGYSLCLDCGCSVADYVR